MKHLIVFSVMMMGIGTSHAQFAKDDYTPNYWGIQNIYDWKVSPTGEVTVRPDPKMKIATVGNTTTYEASEAHPNWPVKFNMLVNTKTDTGSIVTEFTPAHINSSEYQGNKLIKMIDCTVGNCKVITPAICEKIVSKFEAINPEEMRKCEALNVKAQSIYSSYDELMANEGEINSDHLKLAQGKPGFAKPQFRLLEDEYRGINSFDFIKHTYALCKEFQNGFPARKIERSSSQKNSTSAQ